MAQEIGFEKALALSENLWKSTGAASVGALKERLGRRKVNLAAWQSIEEKFFNRAIVYRRAIFINRIPL